MNSSPGKKTVNEIVGQTRTGAVTCEEYARRSLEQIVSCDATIHAFVSVPGEQALAHARKLDCLDEPARKALPLFGVPVAVKDNICTKGTATTCSSKMLADFVPPYDAAVVEALRDAGAVVVGKTNLDEFAMGSTTESSVSGTSRNPHDTERIPGGSSGGSAAAVAAGMVPLALGSDTGGSIRQPSSHCGCVGLKPTYGRVSRYGLVAFASSLDQIGPLAVDCDSAGYMLEVISRPDERDSTNARRPYVHESFAAGLAGVRVGIAAECFGNGLDSGVRQELELVKDGLRREGAELVEIALPHLKLAIATYYIVCTAEASSNLARYDGVKYGYRSESATSLNDMYKTTRHDGFGAEVKRRIMLGTYVLSSGYYDAYYLKAARVRTLIAGDFDKAFGSCDVILSPTAPTPAYRIGEKTDDPLEMYLGDIYTVSANLAGIPGLSVPCGRVRGLPVGAQFLGPHWGEALLLRLGKAVERFRTD